MKTLLIIAGGALLLTACADTRSTTTSRPATVAAVQTEPSAEVRDAQQRLHTYGHYSGPIDGMWGPETQAAVERYQQNRGLAVTGKLDDATRNALRVPAASPVALADPTDVRTIQNRLRQLNFYNGPADGVWGAETQVAMERFQRSRNLEAGQVNVATIQAMGLNPASFPTRHAVAAAPVIHEPLQPGVVRGVQQRLRQYGYYNGRIDGRWGPMTERGLANFQRSRGLEGTGHLNPTTASALGLDPNNLSLSAVPPSR
jgi:peptidoglycan hydrolase-like protein with peptidoglycan-binding domain